MSSKTGDVWHKVRAVNRVHLTIYKHSLLSPHNIPQAGLPPAPQRIRKLEHMAKPLQQKKRPLSICLSDSGLLAFLKLEGTSSCVLGHSQTSTLSPFSSSQAAAEMQAAGTNCCQHAARRQTSQNTESKTTLAFITSGRAPKSQLQTDFNSVGSPHRQQSATWPSVLYCGRERLNSNPYLFALRIQSRRCFIQEQNARLSDEGARYGDALLLPTRQLRPFVSYSGAVFLWMKTELTTKCKHSVTQ